MDLGVFMYVCENEIIGNGKMILKQNINYKSELISTLIDSYGSMLNIDNVHQLH